MNAYHTLELEMNRKFSLRKAEWDSISLERVDTACDPTKSADVAAVIMQAGIAHICLITSSMTLVRAKIDMNIPKKQKGFTSRYEKVIHRSKIWFKIIIDIFIFRPHKNSTTMYCRQCCVT